MPDFCTEEMLVYLDELRNSGATNMFGARPYLQEEFPHLSVDQALDVLIWWAGTYKERHELS